MLDYQENTSFSTLKLDFWKVLTEFWRLEGDKWSVISRPWPLRGWLFRGLNRSLSQKDKLQFVNEYLDWLNMYFKLNFTLSANKAEHIIG